MSVAWDDLRVFLAIARAGSLNVAARTLAVNHSTVFRRLNAFEDQLGIRLFERLPAGYALTLAGEEMRAAAERVENEIERLDRRITGQDLRLKGALSVTTAETVADFLLMRHLAAFKAVYGGIDLGIVLDDQNVNLSKRQADVAVRPTMTPPDTLVGRRVAGIAVAVYAAETSGNENDPSGLPWVAVDHTLAHLASGKWLRKTHPDARVALRANSLTGILAALREGMGRGLLPCFMGDRTPGLKRLTGPISEAKSALWLLTHEDLRHTARVRAFMDFMFEALSVDIDLLEGRDG